MDWNKVLPSFNATLEKMADINITGLSPQTVMKAKQPEPMPTPGLDKARQIIDRANPVIKTASDATARKYKKLRKDIAPVLKGMSVGGMLASISVKQPSNLRRSAGALLGGTVAHLDNKLMEDIKRLERQEKLKKANVLSPAMVKATASKVGKPHIKTGLGSGPSIKQQIPLIGRKGSLPTPGGTP